jgi:hypothetical protein
MKFLAAAILAAASWSASATPLKYEFAGHVDYIGDASTHTDLSAVAGPTTGADIGLNDSMVGYLMYDPASQLLTFPWDPPPDPASSDPGWYRYISLLNALHVQFVQSGEHFGGRASIELSNDGPSDALNFAADHTYLSLGNPDGSPFGNGMLPSSLSLGDFPNQSFSVTWQRPDRHLIMVFGKLDAITLVDDAPGQVPEPGSLSLVLLGLCAAGAIARKARRQG